MDMNSGIESLTTEERARNVSDLLRVLMEINEINGGGPDSAEKMKVHVKNFESALQAKCSTKKEYLSSMKEKINAMINTRDTRQKAALLAKQQARNNAQQQQQQQQQMNNNNTNNNNNNNASNNNFVTNSSNANSRTFLNQQAQARQQAAQQLKQQQQQQQQGGNGNQQGQQRHQLTAQQQLLINQMKVAPIPRELLQKIPNVPPGVNTWQQITELAQQKRFSQDEMLIAKEVYKVHQQLLYKTKMQQQQAQQAQQIKQQEMQAQTQPQKQQQQPQEIMNNMNQQMKQQQLPVQSQLPQQSQPQQPQPQQPQQTQQRNASRSGDMPNVLGQINQIFTPEEQRSLLQEAIEACKHFQRTQYGANMTDATRQNFIRKYINQKALKKIQTIKMSQAAAAAATGSSSANAGNANSNNNNANINNNNNNNTNLPNQQLQRSGSISNVPGNNFSNAQAVPVSQMNSNLKQVPNPMINQQQANQPQMVQQHIRNQQNTGQLQNQPNIPQNNTAPPQNTTSNAANSGMQMFQPTQHDLEMVRKISAAAARIPLRLTDLTNSISPQERNEIKRKLQMNQQLFAQVSNYAPQVYVFTKSEPFLKEVLQLRIFVKEILEKCSRGIYVVKLDTVDKLVMKYQKYWESMKLQILRRQQMIEQQKRQQQQQQQQQQQPQRNITTPQQANIQPNTFVNNNNGGNLVSPQKSAANFTQKQLSQQKQQAPQQQWNGNQSNISPPNHNANSFSPSGFNNAPQTGSISGTPLVQQANLNDMNKNKIPLTNTMSMGTPDLGKVPISQQPGISPKREGSLPHSRKKSESKKPSPAMTSGFSSTNTTTLASKSVTPKNIGTSPNMNNSRTMSTAQQSLSPMATQSTAIPMDMPFKDEVETLESLNIKKGEMISRYKHRQELFRSSPMDIFLGTLADSLGIKDEDMEPPMMKFSKQIIETVNGTGKKKLTKVQQRARDRDLVAIMINDDSKVIMKSKSTKQSRSFVIKLNALSGVFKSAINGGKNDIVDAMVSENEIINPSPKVEINDKKRKFDSLDSSSNVSPRSNNSNDFISPSTGSLMGESKKIKLDSPDDLFTTSFHNSNSISNPDTSKSTKKENLGNVWNWDFWSELQG